MPPPGDLPDPGIKPRSLRSPALRGGFFTTNTSWKALFVLYAELKQAQPDISLSQLMFDLANCITYRCNQIWEWRIKHGNSACEMSLIMNAVYLDLLLLPSWKSPYSPSNRSVHTAVCWEMFVSLKKQVFMSSTVDCDSSYHILLPRKKVSSIEN